MTLESRRPDTAPGYRDSAEPDRNGFPYEPEDEAASLPGGPKHGRALRCPKCLDDMPEFKYCAGFRHTTVRSIDAWEQAERADLVRQHARCPTNGEHLHAKCDCGYAWKVRCAE